MLSVEQSNNVALEHSLDIGHHGLEVLALVEEHAVSVGHLVLPVLLPLGEGVFLEESPKDLQERRDGAGGGTMQRS